MVDVVAAQHRLRVLDHLDADPVLVDFVLDQRRRRAVLHEDSLPPVAVDAVALQRRLALRADGHAAPVRLVDVIVLDLPQPPRVDPKGSHLLVATVAAHLGLGRRLHHDRAVLLALVGHDVLVVLALGQLLLAQLVAPDERVGRLDDLNARVRVAPHLILIEGAHAAVKEEDAALEPIEDPVAPDQRRRPRLDADVGAVVPVDLVVLDRAAAALHRVDTRVAPVVKY